MAQLRDVHREFVKREAEVLAIAPDSPDALARFWTSHEMPFPGLRDDKHEVAELYGQQVKWLKLGRMPAIFIVDREGSLRWERFSNSMSDFPPVDVLLALVDKINEAPNASTE